ncbi:MAG: GNAT family N-acetyltransferase [Chloroflexi bacterium]|jgi:ribosomal protein S18 acetylase RimI-like enzyme|nr:GNAT family N-acetyltransferase [Chloroflexota bacterium]
MVTVAGAPRIPGLRFRTYGGAADAAGLVAVMNGETEADGIDEHLTAAEVAAELEHAAEEDPARTLMIAEMDGRVVAFARRAMRDRGVFLAYEHVGYVHPDLRRRGLGTALLRHQAAALEELAAVHAASPLGGAATHPGAADPGDAADAADAAVGAERVLFSWTDTRHAGAVALLGAEGYAPVRWYLDMERPRLDDLPAAEAPPGISIRAADATDPGLLRAALTAEEEAFRDHWGHHAPSEADTAAMLAEPELDPTLWRLAWDGGEIVGVVRPIVYAEENVVFGRRRVWIDKVSVRRQWRGRGVARALLLAAMAEARDRGLTSAALGVDTDNTTGALGLYERLGFERRSTVMACTKPIADREERS